MGEKNRKEGKRGRTAYEKIVEEHLLRKLPDGSLVLRVDKVACHEITTPPHIVEAQERGYDVVFDPNRIFPMIDHVSPAKDTKTALQGWLMRRWAEKHGLHFFDVGMGGGVCHALIPEIPLVYPGEILDMGDSHTCTSGALNALAIGVGTTDLGVSIMTGFVVIRPQKVIRVNFVGNLPASVYAKDAVLALLKKLGKTGAKNAVLEFHGVFDTMAQRLTISNQGVEGGATSAMWPVDKVTVDYLWPAVIGNYGEDVHPSQVLADLSRWNSDKNCVYDDEITIDVSKLRPATTINYHPSEVVEVASLAGEKIDEVAICSCTNARLEDLRLAAAIIKKMGGKVKVRTVVIPATAHIFTQAMEEGLLKIFMDADCCVSNSSCGPCLGMSCGVLAPGEVSMATTNRNYKDRMGKGGMVHLCSPVTAAYSAMIGYIAEPPAELCAEINATVSKHDQAAPIEFKLKPIPKIDYRALSELFKDAGSAKDFSGMPFYLPRPKVNTDDLIPAEYLTEVDKKAFGVHLLEGMVTDLEERKMLAISKIIVSDIGFGDGSSREQAPWALEGHGVGITCIIAKGFERIFETNFGNTGNLAVTLDVEIVDELFENVPEDIEVVWDTPGDEPGYVSWKDNGSTGYKEAKFEISAFRKSIIRKGGSTGVMLELAAELQEEGKL